MSKEFKFNLVNPGRYTKESMTKAIEQFNARCPVPGEVMPTFMYNEAEHPLRRVEHIDPANVGFMTDRLKVTDSGVEAIITPCGPKQDQLLAQLDLAGCGFGIRGLYSLGPNSRTPPVDLLNIVSIDFVFHGRDETPSKPYGPFTFNFKDPAMNTDAATTSVEFSIPELIANVVQWSTDRGIIANAKVLSQVGKYYEESGELAGGVCKKKHDLTVDSIGDALVVLTNILALTGDDLTRHLEDWDDLPCYVPDGSEITSPLWMLHKHQLYTVCLFDQYLEKEPLNENYIQWAIACLNTLARYEGVTLAHCFNVAWEEIKDRKGFLTPEGVFVKESDA